MRAVDLLPRDEARRQRRPGTSPVLVAAVAAAGAAGLVGVLVMDARGKVAENRDRLGALREELAAIPRPPVASASAGALAAAKQQRTIALSGALGDRVGWDRILRRVSLVLPEDVWLSTLTARAPAPLAVDASAEDAARPRTGGITIDGYTYTHAGVARLLARLAVVPDLANVRLRTSARTTTAAGPATVQFRIEAEVRSS